MPKQKISVLVNMVPFAYGREGMTERQGYLEALRNEITSAADYAADYAVETLSIAGANPLRYSGHVLAGVVKDLRKIFDFKPEAEITVYALPGSVTYADILPMRDRGINRVSFNMASFVPEELETAVRTYGFRTIEVFMRMVQKELVFFNYDVTLAYGIPGQTIESFQYSIEQAIRFMAAHITLLPYDQAVNQDLQTFYRHAQKLFENSGFRQYTPLHFSRREFVSVWNKLNYSNQPRLGFGAGAVSQIDGLTSVNTSDPAIYIAAGGNPAETIVNSAEITQQETDLNTLKNMLYNLQTIDFSTLDAAVQERIQILAGRGLVEVKENLAALTEDGKFQWQAVADLLS